MCFYCSSFVGVKILLMSIYSYVLASALRQMNQTEVITEAPKDCGNTGQIWETGKALFE
jgi:hypothetical protein